MSGHNLNFKQWIFFFMLNLYTSLVNHTHIYIWAVSNLFLFSKVNNILSKPISNSWVFNMIRWQISNDHTTNIRWANDKYQMSRWQIWDDQMTNIFCRKDWLLSSEQYSKQHCKSNGNWKKIQSFIEMSKWNRFQLTSAQTGKFYLCLCPRIPLPCRFPQRIQLFGKIPDGR